MTSLKTTMSTRGCKRPASKALDLACRAIYAAATLWALYWIGQVTTFFSFHVSTDSMRPTVLPGDYGIVNKWRLGARIFDIRAAASGEKVVVRRLPGYGRVERGDIAVFNAPIIGGDTIGMNMRRYYCKRLIGLPGDTIEIRGCHYRIRGVERPVGLPEAQDRLASILELPPEARRYVVEDTWPYDSAARWTVAEFGPLVIPAKGTRILLDRLSTRIYARYIAWERPDGKRPQWRDGRAWIAGEPVDEYIFTHDYYFAAGDYVENSADSRYWGLVPEPMIAGVAWRIWDSIDHSTGRRRWERMGKRLI